MKNENDVPDEIEYDYFNLDECPDCGLPLDECQCDEFDELQDEFKTHGEKAHLHARYT